MTYRKLFLWLVAFGTLVPGGLGALSVGTWTGFSVRPSWHGYSGEVYAAGVNSGTLVLMWKETPGSRAGMNFHRWPDASFPAGMSQLRRKGFSHANSWLDEVTGGHSDAFLVSMPLWFPYLVFIGTVFVIMRVLERRSVSGREKEFVSQAAPDESSRPLPSP